MTPPHVSGIDVSEYTGQVGSLVRVTADDDFGVVSLVVTIRNAAGAVLEQGAAVQSVTGPWVYTAKTAAPAGQSLRVHAEAKDRADKAHRAILNWPVQ